MVSGHHRESPTREIVQAYSPLCPSSFDLELIRCSNALPPADVYDSERYGEETEPGK